MIYFLELHLLDDNEKIMLNINSINSIYQTNGKTNIYAGELIYRVKESYEDIEKMLNKCGLQGRKRGKINERKEES